MKQTTGTGDPRESVEPLTARQREVLELIARGYTNPQIADALGVTIDGAKWHVREILSKLGVESREEAAEWWRHERSAGTRLRRAITGLGSLGALRWVSGVAVVALLTAAGVLALVALRDDDGGRIAPDVLPTAGGPSTATAPPTATESASAEGTLGEIDGRVVYELLYVEEPVDVPRSVLLYYVDQCGVCSGGTLYRGSVSSSGEWAAEELPYAGRGVPAGSQIGPIVSDGQGRWGSYTRCGELVG